MRKLTFSIFVAVLLSLLAVTPAMATTITVNFDNLPTNLTMYGIAYGLVPSPYAGLNWTDWQVMNINTYVTGYGGSNGVPSAPNFALNGDVAISIITSPTLFDFLGADVSTWGGRAQYPAGSVTIRGYNGANLVDTLVVSGLTESWVPSGGINGVTRLEFDTGAGNLYFRMDDFSYNAVPEPLTAGLLGAGLIGLGFLKRRRHKTATANSE
jgi:hypothetical protein